MLPFNTEAEPREANTEFLILWTKPTAEILSRAICATKFVFEEWS